MDFVSVLIALSFALFAGCMFFLSVGAWEGVLKGFLSDVRDESGGSMSGAGTLAVRRLSNVSRRLMWPSYEANLRKKLVKAGEPKGYKPEDIMSLQMIGALVGLIFGLFVCNSLDLNFGLSLVGVAVGAYYPQMWVSDQVKKRHKLITRALPYNLDLLTLSVEAGLDFTGALGKVVEKGKPGPLREELQMVLKQLKMGKTREEALKAMMARVDLPALTSFVTSLVQADKMGTSLGKVLRIQSTQLRIERTQRAEKLAGEAPVKMLFPLIACIFPTVFMVLFAPIVFAFYFGDALG